MAQMGRPKVSEGTPRTVAVIVWPRHVEWLEQQDESWSAAIRRAIDEQIEADEQIKKVYA